MKRLVQGVNTAFELYQYHIGQLFKDFDLINNISDDIVIGGVDQEDHDRQLEACFKILRQNNLTINLKKCQFSKREIKFFGFTISADGVKPTHAKLDTVLNFKEPQECEGSSQFFGLDKFLWQIHT